MNSLYIVTEETSCGVDITSTAIFDNIEDAYEYCLGFIEDLEDANHTHYMIKNAIDDNGWIVPIETGCFHISKRSVKNKGSWK